MTPLEKFGPVYLKREDQNPTGSAKDRALKAQVQNLLRLDYHSAVISSTGNAAISASYFCQQNNLPLTVFVSPKINQPKLRLIRAKIVTTCRPISRAFKFANSHHSYLLRQSTDPTAQDGYSQIGQELLTQLPSITSIFIPVGSGATLVGLSRHLPPTVKVYAVQPASHCPIAGLYDYDFTPEKSTITDSLNAKLLPLKSKITNIIATHRGGGVVVQNNEVIAQHQYLLKNKITVSPESALALAGYYKVSRSDHPGQYPVILLTGALR